MGTSGFPAAVERPSQCTPTFVRVLVLLVLLFLASSVRLPSLRGQEADVRAAVTATLAAWTQGDFDSFTSHYHEDVRGFFLEGAPLTRGFDTATLGMAYEAGMKAQVMVRDLDVRVYGEVAVSVAYLDGSVSLPGGEQTISGTWRYSETRIPSEGTWKVVQYHFSRLAGTR